MNYSAYSAKLCFKASNESIGSIGTLLDTSFSENCECKHKIRSM